jgi:curli biogenesis system outer membrane secretion channel CsgG
MTAQGPLKFPLKFAVFCLVSILISDSVLAQSPNPKRKVPTPAAPAGQPAERTSRPATRPNAAENTSARTVKKVVMVPDFDARGIYHWWPGNWDIGSLFANSTMGPLSRTESFEVVERGRTRDVIAEQVTSESERFNQPAIAKAGRLLGADYILFGDILDFSRKKGGILIKEVQVSIRLSARLVSVATGKVFKATELNYLSNKTKEFPLTSQPELNPNDPEFLQSLFGKAITEAAAQIVTQLTGEGGNPTLINAAANPGRASNAAPNAVPVETTAMIADVTGNTVVINWGSANGVKTGWMFAVVRVVKEIRDPKDPSKVIMKKTEELARIKITSVQGSASEGTLVSGKPENLAVGVEVVRVN